jgi:uncharacterized protein
MEGIFEYKSILGELKDIDTKKRIVTGYLSAFGNEDYSGDIMVRGAFTKSLKERKNQIFFLNQHNWAQPHGRFNVLQEDEKGLYFESEPLIDTTYSSDLLKLYEAGIVKEHSIGYVTVDKEIDKKGRRLLKEVKLYEGSNVTLGMNPDTPFTGFKSNIKELNQQQKAIITAMRKGTFTDETFVLLEIALKQLQLEAYELGKKESLQEPSANDTLIIEPISQIRDFINLI